MAGRSWWPTRPTSKGRVYDITGGRRHGPFAVVGSPLSWRGAHGIWKPPGRRPDIRGGLEVEQAQQVVLLSRPKDPPRTCSDLPCSRADPGTSITTPWPPKGQTVPQGEWTRRFRFYDDGKCLTSSLRIGPHVGLLEERQSRGPRRSILSSRRQTRMRACSGSKAPRVLSQQSRPEP